MFSSFFHMFYYINCFSTWYVWLLLEKKKKKKKKTLEPCHLQLVLSTSLIALVGAASNIIVRHVDNTR